MMPGVYIHVPFCRSKCPYCDFYSLPRISEEALDAYTKAVEANLRRFAGQSAFSAETVYFGGGTPSVLGARRLNRLLSAVDRFFPLQNGAEVTAEMNPAGWEKDFFDTLRAGGFTRISMGMQSANESELRLLGRNHHPEDVRRAMQAAHKAGFTHLSLDIMTALPVPSEENRLENLRRSAEICRELGADHVSAYMLKVEDGTFYARHPERYAFPDEETACRDYRFVADTLESLGYKQYEISNFAAPGGESQHNLLYWHDEEYLGIGPAAHSFLNGRRFYYPRDFKAFLNGALPEEDGPGGSFEEYVMLSLRLTEGITRPACVRRFGETGGKQFDTLHACAVTLARQQSKDDPLLVVSQDRVALTRSGFLVSNTIIVSLLDALL